ncbi:MAG: glycosyltransferase family 4 protein [Clostridia bacterium]|nr:glycosyltransferase family 4 protein [Clostridia bacterium]
MKVLLLVVSYPPVLNSTARLFSELAEGLAARGHQVTVLTSYPERYLAGGEGERTEQIPAKEQRNGVEVHRLGKTGLPKHVPLLRGIEHLVYGIQYFMHGRHLRRHDVVIAYSPPLPLGIAAVNLARKWQGACLVNVQDLYPQSAVDLGLLRNRALIRLGRWMERSIYRYADAITVHSEGNRAHVVAHGGSSERTWVIPNWIDLAKYKPGPKDNDLRQKYASSSNFVVSYAGVMGFAQGAGDILEAATLVAREAPEILFLLAGEGVMVPRLKELATRLGLNNVRFLPHMPESDYIALLQASDVCLVSLHKDIRTPVVPGKLPCIMGVGRPAICSTPPASDARLIVEEADCGLWVPAGSPKVLAEAILALWSDPARAERMGVNGRKYAETRFDREKCIAQYESLIGELT